jgi:hypothetical protein
VLTPDKVVELASRVAFLLDQGVARIGASPSVLPSPDWGPSTREALAAQLEEIWLMLEPWRERGARLPFSPFRQTRSQAGGVGESGGACAAERALSPAVDVDGRVYACAAFAGWKHAGGPPSEQAVADIACLGDIREPGFAGKRDAFRLSASWDSLRRSSERSAGTACELCPAASACPPCPASRLLGDGAPSAFVCDWLRFCAEYRRRYAAPSKLQGWLADRGLLA